jgi:hypothetical protein
MRGENTMMDTAIRWLKRLGFGGGAIMALAYVLFCLYSLPSQLKVHVTGTEVTRKNAEARDGVIRPYDVRYVMAEDLDGDAHMFRNQDTGWGWPPFFKFDSGDIAAQANNYAVDAREEVVLIKYYGFRIHMLSAFPNIVSMKTVPADYQAIPWFNIIFVFAHIILVGVIAVFIRDFREGREETS